MGLMSLELNFQDSDIGEAGALAVAEIIPVGLTRLCLNFADCGIGDAGKCAIEEIIPADDIMHFNLNFR